MLWSTGFGPCADIVFRNWGQQLLNPDLRTTINLGQNGACHAATGGSKVFVDHVHFRTIQVEKQGSSAWQ